MCIADRFEKNVYNKHYSCNHDCDAIYEAYELGKKDGRKESITEGEWIHYKGDGAYCSVCKVYISEKEYNDYIWNFCPICGAKMLRNIRYKTNNKTNKGH